MEAITAFLESFDIAELLPELGAFLSDLRFWAGFFLLIGPLVMLALGLWYFFLPPKEANHHIGFRCKNGMGSVAAWRYSQRLAGLLYMIVGGALTLLSLILIIVMVAAKPMAMATTAVVVMVIQALAALALWIILQVIIGKHFDKDGNRK